MLKAVFGSSEDSDEGEAPTLPSNVIPLTPDIFDKMFG